MIPKEINIVISDIWPMLLLFVIVLFTIRIIDIIVNKRKLLLYKDLFILSFILYMFLLFGLVTSTDFESYSNNFIPFKEIMRYSLSSSLFYKNVIGNVLLFVPFGYFINSIIDNRKLIINLIITFITSLSIEIIQMNIDRSFDIDDIILNMIGGVLGYLIYRFLCFIKDKLPNVLKRVWLYNLIWIFMFVLGTIFVLNYYNIWEVLWK